MKKIDQIYVDWIAQTLDDLPADPWLKTGMLVEPEPAQIQTHDSSSDLRSLKQLQSTKAIHLWLGMTWGKWQGEWLIWRGVGEREEKIAGLRSGY